MTLASRPGQPLLDDERVRLRRRSPRRPRRSDVADRDALARREPVGLDDDPAVRGEAHRVGQARRRVRLGERPAPGHRDARRLGDLPAERLRALDPGRGGARAEDREPGVRERVGDAGGQRRLRPDDDELGGEPPGDRDDRRTVERIDGLAADPRLRRDPVGSGRDEDLVDARLGGELPGQRVLAAAAADDQDPGRLDQARQRRSCARHRGRWRIGRQARSIVCVRSGPTETSTIGAPACSSSAVT